MNGRYEKDERIAINTSGLYVFWMFSVPLSFIWVQFILRFPVPLCYISLAIPERSQYSSNE